MEKIKKILTDPKLAHYWQELNEEMICRALTKDDVTKALKKLGLSKRLITEYGETYYLMCVIDYVAENIEGLNFEWVNKETLEIKECYKEQIDDAKRIIMYNLNKLLDYEAINLNAAEEVKAKLDLPDMEDEDDDDLDF